MKIKVKKEFNRLTYVNSITSGTFFVKQNETSCIYMKLKVGADRDYNCVNLDDGDLELLSPYTLVYPMTNTKFMGTIK